MSNDVYKEIRKIGKIIDSAGDIESIKRSISKADGGTKIINSEYTEYGGMYDIIVKECKDVDGLTRRMELNFPDIAIDEIVAGVVGVKRRR